MATRKPHPRIGESAALTLVGVIIGLAALWYATRGTADELDAASQGALVVMGLGALIFAVGAMMLLVSVVRPLFEKRPVDDLVDRHLHGPR
jgi:hypothetical protein